MDQVPMETRLGLCEDSETQRAAHERRKARPISKLPGPPSEESVEVAHKLLREDRDINNQERHSARPHTATWHEVYQCDEHQAAEIHRRGPAAS